MTKEISRLDPKQKEIVSRHTSDFPVKLGQMAKELGVAGVRVSSMKTGASGQIKREADGYIIRVNRNEARERQRFTIAHELAHFLLHKRIIDRSPDGITDNVLYRSGAPEKIEYEANRLAAELVMPTQLIREVLKNDFQGVITEATIESLSSRFDVSKAAMEIKLTSISDS